MQVNYVCLDKKEIDTDSNHGIKTFTLNFILQRHFNLLRRKHIKFNFANL